MSKSLNTQQKNNLFIENISTEVLLTIRGKLHDGKKTTGEEDNVLWRLVIQEINIRKSY